MTAVEWLYEQIQKDQYSDALSPLEWIKVIEKAKEMEKQQIELAVQHGHNIQPTNTSYKWCGIEYYNKTYAK